MAQNANPLFHDDVMLVMATSRYPSHCLRHHSCNARTLAAIAWQVRPCPIGSIGCDHAPATYSTLGSA